MLSKQQLDAIYSKYNKYCLISPDPLQFVYKYKNNEDRETVALIAACFAYGNVKQIIKTADKILAILGPSPKEFILKTDRTVLSKAFAGFKYRFTDENELVNFLLSIQKILKEYGSLQSAFCEEYSKNKDYVAALRAFAAKLRNNGKVDTLVPDPSKGSALKRLNLFLRWCARHDEVDPGCWDKVPASCLIVPLDVHMHRVAKMLGLTKRNQANMKTAVEISQNFAAFCPQDPVRYDFSLTRFGIRPDMSEDELLEKLETLKKNEEICKKN